MVSTQIASNYPPSMSGPLDTHVPPPPPSLAPPNSSNNTSNKKRSSAPPPPPNSSYSLKAEDSKKIKLDTPPPPPPPPPLPTASSSTLSTKPPPPPPPPPSSSQSTKPPPPPPPPPHLPPATSSSQSTKPPPPPPPPPPTSIPQRQVGQKSLPQGGTARPRPTTSAPPPPPPPPMSNINNKLVENRKINKPPAAAAAATPAPQASTSIGRYTRQNQPRPGTRICHDLSDYERVRQVGKGTFGEVFQARCKRTNRRVALKKLLMVSPANEGFPIYSIREINILKAMKRHENIVELVEIVTCGARRGVNSSPGEDDEHTGGNSSIYMVFEYMEFDLQGLLNASKVDPNVKITSFHVRSWTKQLLEGVAFIHQNNMLHRDLKGGNILISADNRLKIADFGLARPEFQNVQKYTGNLLTLGFRPPEVMMGMPKYTNSVDMWSVGCILAELLLRKPLFPVYQGQSEIDHLASIFKICGTPKISEESPQLAPNSQYRYDLWPSVATDCLNWKCYESNQPLPRLLQNEFEGNAHEILRHKPLRVGKPGISIHAVDLLEKMLHLDPHKRITAQNALDHDYFFKEGPVKTHTQLPKFKITSAHEMEIRNQHLERRDKLNAQREKASQANAAQAYP